MVMTRTYFGGKREFYKSRHRGGSNLSFAIYAGARDELASRMMAEGVHPAAMQIAASCNEASSWGGYTAFTGDQVARVYGVNSGSSDRGRRLLSAVDQAVV